MALTLLDINDSNLQLWQGDQALSSPGYALLEGNGYRFGQGARAAARLRPRDINTRFWWQLSTEALQPALGPARHTADLVHAHLQELHRAGGEPAELLLAVSASMQREQLSLLLGIAQACPFETVGLVNRSVALASLYGGAGRSFHLEIQLHQSVISTLAVNDATVELQGSVPLPGCGLLQLQERLVETIAAAFIRQTRFDPRRKAETEQDLYDSLPRALEELRQRGETNLEVNGYRARINRGDLLQAGGRLFSSAADALGALDAADRVFADPLAGLLPGLAEQLPQVQVLPGDALSRAVQRHGEALVQRGEALSFVTALPLLAAPAVAGGESAATPAVTEQTGTARSAATEPAAPETAAPRPATPRPAAPQPATPTHMLAGAHARPLAEGVAIGIGWELRREGEHWLLRGGESPAPAVNGEPCGPDQALAPGDRIRLADGTQVLLIEVDP